MFSLRPVVPMSRVNIGGGIKCPRVSLLFCNWPFHIYVIQGSRARVCLPGDNAICQYLGIAEKVNHSSLPVH